MAAALPLLAQQLLEGMAAQLVELGVDVPDLQYVGAGAIPWDGPSLTVYLGEVHQGQPGAPFAGSYIAVDQINLSGQLWVQLLRASPTISDSAGGYVDLPDADEMGAAGFQAMTDAKALVDAAIALKAAGTLTELGTGFVIGPAQPLGPEGNLQAMRIAIEVSL